MDPYLLDPLSLDSLSLDLNSESIVVRSVVVRSVVVEFWLPFFIVSWNTFVAVAQCPCKLGVGSVFRLQKIHILRPISLSFADYCQVVYECVFPSPVSGRRPLDNHCPADHSLNTILVWHGENIERGQIISGLYIGWKSSHLFSKVTFLDFFILLSLPAEDKGNYIFPNQMNRSKEKNLCIKYSGYFCY